MDPATSLEKCYVDVMQIIEQLDNSTTLTDLVYPMVYQDVFSCVL